MLLGRDRTGFLDGLWAPQVLLMTEKCQRTASEKPACPSNQGLNLKPMPGPAAGPPLQQGLVYQNCLKPAFTDFLMDTEQCLICLSKGKISLFPFYR